MQVTIRCQKVSRSGLGTNSFPILYKYFNDRYTIRIVPYSFYISLYYIDTSIEKEKKKKRKITNSIENKASKVSTFYNEITSSRWFCLFPSRQNERFFALPVRLVHIPTRATMTEPAHESSYHHVDATLLSRCLDHRIVLFPASLTWWLILLHKEYDFLHTDAVNRLFFEKPHESH